MEQPESRLESLRWPDGPRCPGCGSADVAGSVQQRRCRACKLSFRWSTRTALHATKLPADAWVRAVALTAPDAASVGAELGCSAPTARRVAALLDSTALPAGSPPEAKLQTLLRSPPRPPRRQRGRGEEARSQLEHAVGSLSRGERLVIAALRLRVFGASVRTVAALGGLSAGHARRCLNRLRCHGWVACESRTWLWGYSHTRRRVWRLTWSGTCAEMLGIVRHEPVEEPPRGSDDMVPPEFWIFNFWSGTPADKLRIGTHGLLIAETLLTGHDPAARQWALTELPVEVLAQCRQLRGCDTGSVAADIDAAIAGRSG